MPIASAGVILTGMYADMKRKILVDRRIGRCDDMSQADLFAGYTKTRHAQPSALQMFIIVMEDQFKKLFHCELCHFYISCS